MVKLTFVIDKSNTDKNGFAPIKANVTIDYKKKRITIEKVKPRYWNNKTQRVNKPKPHEPDNDHERINDFLKRYQDDANAYFKQCHQNNIPVTPELAGNYLKGDKTTIGTKQITLWDAYQEYLNAGQLEKSPNTNRNRLTIYNKLKEFEDKTGYKLTWQSVDLVFWDKLKTYVLDKKEHGFNYLSAIADKFKAFMTWSHERNYNTNTIYKRFSAPEKEPTIIKLTWDELQTLISFKFENETLAKARDFFCFGCLCGLRYIDLAQLTKDNIIDGAIKTTTQKTNKEVEIPLFPGLQTIIDRYPEPYRLLPKFANATLNRYLKKVCETAEINTPTEWKTFQKNETKKEFLPKFELIGTHTARKTFINLAYAKGIDIEAIKNITGITREKTLKRYLDISIETKREKLNTAFGSL
jgi:integrase